MEILLVLAIIIIASFWVKNQYPDSPIGKLINNALFSLFNKADKVNVIHTQTKEVHTEAEQTITEQSVAESNTVILEQHNVESLSESSEAALNSIPEDATLRRHYLTQLASIAESVADVEQIIVEQVVVESLPASAETVVETVIEASVNPIPEDATLRRHYLTQLAAEQAGEPVTESIPIVQEHSADSVLVNQLTLPEDVVLRRHFLTQLRAEITTKLFPQPSDSTLLRHYESIVQAEIAKALAS